MTKPVSLDVEAQQELAGAVAWYDLQTQGFELGIDLLDAVEEAVGQVAQYPQAQALAPGVPRGLGVRRLMVRRFPFSLVFVELPDEVRIVAVAHVRRRPGYWRVRL